MSNKFVDQEVSKIIKDKELSYPLNLAMASAWILANLKGINLKILDVERTSSLSDFFVLVSAQNIIQARTMADHILEQLKKHEAKCISREGFESAEWILLDFGDIIIHIFQESTRGIYNLDELWRNSPQVSIPESYYFALPKSTLAEKESESRVDEEGYF